MVRITIDTEKDSHHTIQKIIALLQQFASGTTPVQTNAPTQVNFYQQSSYQENTPAGSSGFNDLFGSMPSSEPVKQSNSYADLFAPKDPEPRVQESTSLRPQQTTNNFFDMMSGTKQVENSSEFSHMTTPSASPSSSSWPATSASSGGMFDMFAQQNESPNNTSDFMTDMFAPNQPSEPANQDANSPFSVNQTVDSQFSANQYPDSQFSANPLPASQSSVDGFPSVFDDYLKDEKEDFSRKDYLKVQEYDD